MGADHSDPRELHVTAIRTQTERLRLGVSRVQREQVSADHGGHPATITEMTSITRPAAAATRRCGPP